MSPPWRHTLWLAFLVAASVAFTLGFACAVPFAAFGAAAAITMRPREALYLTVALWLANQIVGFTVLGYPRTTSTFVWGIVLGGVAVLATVSAQSVTRHLNERAFVIVALAAFTGAFIAYEGGLFVVSATLLGGTENFIPATVARILEINVAAFVGLLVLNRLASAAGLTVKPVFT
jgi:hypothetical protein